MKLDIKTILPSDILDVMAAFKKQFSIFNPKMFFTPDYRAYKELTKSAAYQKLPGPLNLGSRDEVEYRHEIARKICETYDRHCVGADGELCGKLKEWTETFRAIEQREQVDYNAWEENNGEWSFTYIGWYQHRRECLDRDSRTHHVWKNVVKDFDPAVPFTYEPIAKSKRP